jgi:anti-sigma factor RsiW
LQTQTDLDIQALVDSQLDWEEEKRVWSYITQDPALYARYQELLTQKKLLVAWWNSEQAHEFMAEAGFEADLVE